MYQVIDAANVFPSLASDSEASAHVQVFNLGVLIVDDQEPFRKRARAVLEAQGSFRVIAEASDGIEALRLMEQVRAELVLMDVLMPQMNGFEAARLIHQRYPGAVVALLSMTGEPEYARVAQEVGAWGFIPKKDLSPSALRRIIQISESRGALGPSP